MLLQSVAALVAVAVVTVGVEGDRADTYEYSPPPARYPDSQESQDSDESTVRPNFNYNFAVKDDFFNNNFGQQKTRDGENTKGSYYVQLPDGRLQKVTYYVDGDSGYVAEVSYEGEAREYVPKPRKVKESSESKTLSRSHASKESEKSYSPARPSYRPRESRESYAAGKTSHGSSESKESRESYTHTSVSYQSLQSEESQEAATHSAPAKTVRKEQKPDYTYPSPSRTPAAAKPSRRRSKHSSEEREAYSSSKSSSGRSSRPKTRAPKESHVKSSRSQRTRDSEESDLRNDSEESQTYSLPSKSSGRSQRPRKADSDEGEIQDVPHSASEERSNHKDSNEASAPSAAHDSYSYDAPVYVAQHTNQETNSYSPVKLLA